MPVSIPIIERSNLISLAADINVCRIDERANKYTAHYIYIVFYIIFVYSYIRIRIML